jgi:hypothetical protein
MEEIFTFRIPHESRSQRFVIPTLGEILLVLKVELLQDVPHMHLLLTRDKERATIIEQADPRQMSSDLNETAFHIYRTGDALQGAGRGKMLSYCGGYTMFDGLSYEPRCFHVFREIPLLVAASTRGVVYR